jgi:hypothetical protein
LFALSMTASAISYRPQKFMSEYLIHRRILLKPHHEPTGRTRHTQGSWSPEGLVRGVELPVPHELVIAQLPPDEGYYLLYLDETGHEITDTYHDSLEKALDQAKWEFGVAVDEWAREPGG